MRQHLLIILKLVRKKRSRANHWKKMISWTESIRITRQHLLILPKPVRKRRSREKSWKVLKGDGSDDTVSLYDEAARPDSTNVNEKEKHPSEPLKEDGSDDAANLYNEAAPPDSINANEKEEKPSEGWGVLSIFFRGEKKFKFRSSYSFPISPSRAPSHFHSLIRLTELDMIHTLRGLAGRSNVYLVPLGFLDRELIAMASWLKCVRFTEAWLFGYWIRK